MNKQDGIEERAKASVCQERYLQSTVYREGVDDATAECEAETAMITDERDRLKEALRSIQHITDCHGCGRYRVLCSACEATRIAMEALIDDNGDA